MKICNHCNIELNNSNWNKSNLEKGLKICSKCNYEIHKKYNPLKEEDPTKWEKSNNLRKIQKIKLKLETIKAYGEKCVKCEENRPLFLILDHVNLLPPKGGSFMFHRLFTRRRLNMFLFNVRLRTTTRHFR